MIRTRVGYAGGTTSAPTYRAMGDHTEALEIDFDPRVISYEDVMAKVWAAHDPTRARRSVQYRAVIWARDESQRASALAMGEAAAERCGGVLTTPIEPWTSFTRAEDYHQKYSLRRVPVVVEALIERFGTDRGMVDSTEAARINALLRGYAEIEDVMRAVRLGPRAERVLRARC